MTIFQLLFLILKQIFNGYGNKKIFVEDGQEMFHIHSIQKNTSSNIEPDYLFIMNGDLKEE